jgi:hypothetical protein
MDFARILKLLGKKVKLAFKAALSSRWRCSAIFFQNGEGDT